MAAKRRRSLPSSAAAVVRRLVVVAVAAAAAAATVPGGPGRYGAAAAVVGGGGEGGRNHLGEYGDGVGGAISMASDAVARARLRKAERRRILAASGVGEEEDEEEEEEEEALLRGEAMSHGGGGGGGSSRDGRHGGGHGGGHGGSQGDGHGGGHGSSGRGHAHATGGGGGPSSSPGRLSSGVSGGGGGGEHHRPATDAGTYFSYVRRAFHITDAEDGEANADSLPRLPARSLPSRNLLGRLASADRGSTPSAGRVDGEEEEANEGDGGDGHPPHGHHNYGEEVEEEGGGGSPALPAVVKKVVADTAGAVAKAVSRKAKPLAEPGSAESREEKPKGALEIGSDTVGVFHGVPAQPNQRSDNVTRLSFMLWRVIKTYHIKSLVDVPCRAHGSWMPQLLARLDYDLPEFRYYCVDASPRVIKEAKAMVGDLVDSHFVVRDWWARRLPSADLIFSWRGLDTSPSEHVHRLLSHIPGSDAKYLLLGSADAHNDGKGLGAMGMAAAAMGAKKWAPPINFRKAPFRLPQHPMRVIKEVTLPTAAHSRSLLLYQVADLTAPSPPPKGGHGHANVLAGAVGRRAVRL
ncbi:hypothetical protein MMPV_000020 [Pyropia vietnamensis]